MKTSITTSLIVVAAALSINSAHAFDMIITAREGAGAESSTMPNTYQETFDNLPTGVNNNVSWSGVGTFDTVNIKNADVYGGAAGSKYAVEGLGVVNKTTLTLNSPSSYFGLWWSAGDAANVLNFYNSGNLVGSFTTANLINLLPNSYKGNPDTALWYQGQNSGEKYGFINFIADKNTTWDKIEFTNSGGSGFEADNYTSRVGAWSPSVDGSLPGTPYLRLKDGVYTAISSLPANFQVPGAPAPSFTACLAFAGVLLLQALRRAKTAA